MLTLFIPPPIPEKKKKKTSLLNIHADASSAEHLFKNVYTCI